MGLLYWSPAGLAAGPVGPRAGLGQEEPADWEMSEERADPVTSTIRSTNPNQIRR